MLNEAVLMLVGRVERHQERVKRIVIDGLNEDEGIIMSGYPQKAYNALVSGFLKCLNCSVFGEDFVSVLFGLDVVELPAIEVVGLQPPQAVIQVCQRALVVAITDLSHEENLVTAISNGLAHHFLAVTVVVIPAVVEERQAVVDRLMHESDGGHVTVVAGRLADMPATEAKDRNIHARSAQRPLRQACSAILLSGEYLVRQLKHDAGCCPSL